MRRTTGVYLSAGLALAGALLLVLGSLQQITITLDGQNYTTTVLAFTVEDALQAAGVTLQADDRVYPPRPGWLPLDGLIRVERARPALVWYEGRPGPLPLWSSERRPANLLAELGVRLFPGDRFYVNGQLYVPNQPMPPVGQNVLHYRPGTALAVSVDGRRLRFSSSAATLGQALWEAGVRLGPGDAAVPSLQTALDGAPLAVTVRRARAVTLRTADGKLHTRSAAETVGQALAEAGLALQGLDYSKPGDDQPLPADGVIRVVRVREETQLEQTALPFKKEFVGDETLELDQQREVQTGQPGVQVKRVRIRYEDGEEVARQDEGQWVADPPRSQKIAYGTHVVIRTLQTPSGPIEYWRAVNVFATSYSPCRLGVPGKCSTRTASGRELKKGVAGASAAWYRLLLGQQIYVPDYGTAVIADYGKVPGYWIDLGFSDDDFAAWHRNVTIYFLTPVPASIPWILPQ